VDGFQKEAEKTTLNAFGVGNGFPVLALQSVKGGGGVMKAS
jgi:hypothetical protein